MRRAATTPADAGRQAASQVYHEVYKDNLPTGRRFTSLISAQRYAQAVNGEVRAERK